MYQVDLEIFYWISKNYDIATLEENLPCILTLAIVA